MMFRLLCSKCVVLDQSLRRLTRIAANTYTESFLQKNNSSLLLSTRSLAHKAKQNKEKKNEDHNNSSPFSTAKLIGIVLAGVSILTGIYGTKQSLAFRNQITINWDEFYHLLEIGEVRTVILSDHNSKAYVILHDLIQIHDQHTKWTILDTNLMPRETEARIRSYEESLGISQKDRIEIENRGDDFAQDAASLNQKGLALVFIASGVMTLLTAFILFGKGSKSAFFRGSKLTKEEIEKMRTRYRPPKASAGRYVPPYGPADGFKQEDIPIDKQQRLKKPSTGPMSMFMDPFQRDPIMPTKSDFTFDDVVGLHASKQEVMEFVSYLKYPKKYQRLGAKLPKGALLLGPPGCGKTLLVKALSNEADVPFFSMAGSEFVEIIGGLGAQRMRRLFEAAREDSPAIIFIDEIDSVGRQRSNNEKSNSEAEQTLNQLLVEMDGIDTKAGIIVFAATNRADLLDKALLRPGRFDRHVYIDLPNLMERKELFYMFLRKYKLHQEIILASQVDRMATLTPGMSGADIGRLCNEAALIAARRDNYSQGVTLKDFDRAFERVIAGSEKKTNPLSERERHISAVRVAGRTLVSWFSPLAHVKPAKVSILPRMSGLGFTHFVEEERRLLNTDEIAARTRIMLGGRAAEQLIFNAISDASQRDLKSATDLAFQQTRQWGMSPKIGHLSFEIDPIEESFGLRPYSKKTQHVIEEEVTRIVADGFHAALNLIKEHRNLLDALIEALLEKEVLELEDLSKLLPEHVK